MGDFVTQFLPQIMPLIIFLGICIVLMIALQVMLYRLRKKRQLQKKAAIDAMGKQSKRQTAKEQKTAPVLGDEPVVELELDGDPLAELNALASEPEPDEDPLAELQAASNIPDSSPQAPEASEDGLDPLAELYAAREEAEHEEAAVSFSSLLEEQKPISVHTVAQETVSVTLNSGQIVTAREELSILRDESDKRLMILDGDTAYRTLLDDPASKERFSALMKELSGVILKPDEKIASTETNEGDELASLLASMGEAPHYRIPKEEVTVRLHRGGTSEVRSLLSILRDESDGRLMILAGSKAYRTLQDDPKMRKGFTILMKELSAVILTPDPRATDMPKPDHKPGSQETAALSAMSETISADADDLPERLPGDLPDLSLPDNPDNYRVGRFGRVSVKRVDRAPEINIAEAIEAYLQYKISLTPNFQKRGIHIRAAISGGVRIEADGKNYDFVDEVADVEVRTFLQETINEWQDRH